MLKFESVFWASKNQSELQKKLESLGFDVTPSRRDPHTQSLDFGSDSIEIFAETEKLSTLTHHEGAGIVGLGLESDHIADDYRRLLQKKENAHLKSEKPRIAKEGRDGVPLWTGFSLPPQLTPNIGAWVVMNSPSVLEEQSRNIYPLTHPNTCFGVEGIHVLCSDPEETIGKWAELVQRPSAGLRWNEVAPTTGKRIQIGERFFDALSQKPDLLKLTGGRSGVFMLTLKVADLELARLQAQKAGANPKPCHNRDGFYLESFTEGCALRFVRSFWKRYLPVINSNYPLGRRPDQFRPLGGANSSTLIEGFDDNWNY